MSQAPLREQTLLDIPQAMHRSIIRLLASAATMTAASDMVGTWAVGLAAGMGTDSTPWIGFLDQI